MSGLEDAVVVVTGAGSGIGRATALHLASLGARPVLVARNAGPLEQVAKEIPSSVVVAADIADPDAPARIVAAAGKRLDAIVNNAAIGRHMPIAAWDRAGFEEHVAVNVTGPYFLIQAALPLLRESPIRSIVNVSSVSGTLRPANQSVYGMTKAALDYLTSSLAAELASDGIRVNAIAPGPTDTPVHATWAENLDEAYAFLSSLVPLGRMGDAAEMARWIAHLLGPDSSYVTGAVIPVDGGQAIARG